MSKIRQWKKLLTNNTREKVQVRVGEKIEAMTTTQSYRFDELTKGSKPEQSTAGNPLEQSRYTLAEASFRLMLSEQEILQQAAAGSITLHANVAGREGIWRQAVADGCSKQSSIHKLNSGYLALTVQTCIQLLNHDHAVVSVLEFHPTHQSASNIDRRIIETLIAWGGGKIAYCLTEPVRLTLDDVVLLTPVPGIELQKKG